MSRRPSVPTSADQRLAIRSRALTVYVVREPETCYGQLLSAPCQAADLARALIGDAAQEIILGIWLDARNRAIGHTEISRGTVNASRFAPRDVLTPALLVNAVSAILVHNHPSNEASPSHADRVVTTALRQACRIVGLVLVDHIIVTQDSHYSFADSDQWAGEF